MDISAIVNATVRRRDGNITTSQDIGTDTAEPFFGRQRDFSACSQVFAYIEHAIGCRHFDIIHRDVVALPIDFITRIREIVVIVYISGFRNETNISFIRAVSFRIREYVAEIVDRAVDDLILFAVISLVPQDILIGCFGGHGDTTIQRDHIRIRQIYNRSFIGRKRDISAFRKEERLINNSAICGIDGNISRNAHIFRRIGDRFTGDFELTICRNIGVRLQISHEHIPVTIHGDILRVESIDIELPCRAIFKQQVALHL